MSTNEETRFALGVLAAIVVVSLAALALQAASDSESAKENPAKVSRLNSEPPRTSRVASSTRSSSASSESANESLSANTNAQPAPVIDPVPLDFFDAANADSELPGVLEKYRDRVARGALFMARLEEIVTDRASVHSNNQHNLSLQFTARSKSKRLSYKSVHVAEWIEATFDSAVFPATRDVLVDVRRARDSAVAGERVALFFASIQEYADKPGFAINADVVEDDTILRVYELTDLLPQLGEARLTQPLILATDIER